jgi:hypothetical protein
MAMYSRKCAVCGQVQGPWIAEVFAAKITSHEFECYTNKPELVPEQLRAYFHSLVIFKKRSAASRRGHATRKLSRRSN